MGTSTVRLFATRFLDDVYKKQVQRGTGLSRTTDTKTQPLSQVGCWKQGVRPKGRGTYKKIIALAPGSFSKTLGCWVGGIFTMT